MIKQWKTENKGERTMTEESQHIRDIQQSIANRSIKRTIHLSNKAHQGEPQVIVAEELRFALEVLSELAATLQPEFLVDSGITHLLTEKALEKGRDKLNTTYLSNEEDKRKSAEKSGTQDLAASHELIRGIIKDFYAVRSLKDLH